MVVVIWEMIEICRNGETIEFNKTDYFFTVKVGGVTWYWHRRDGRFAGTLPESFEDEEAVKRGLKDIAEGRVSRVDIREL